MDIVNRAEQITITTKRTIIKLVKEDIIRYINDYHRSIGSDEKVEVTFTVPGGADWSGMEIEIDRDNPIVVEIESKVTKKT